MTNQKNKRLILNMNDILIDTYDKGLGGEYKEYTTDEVLDIIHATLDKDTLCIEKTGPEEGALMELEHRVELVYTFFYTEFIHKDKILKDKDGESIKGEDAQEFVAYDIWWSIGKYIPEDMSNKDKKKYKFLWITIVFGMKLTKVADQLEIAIDTPETEVPKKTKKDKQQTLPRPENCTLATITHKDYWSSFSPLEVGKAHLKVLENEFNETIQIENSVITLKGRDDVELTLQDIRTSEIIRDVDFVLLKSIYSYIYLNKKHLNGYTFDIKISDLANYLGVNPRGANGKQLMQAIREFDRVLAVHPNGSMSKVLGFIKHDTRNGILSITSPFFIDLMESIEQDTIRFRKIKGTEQKYQLPAYSYLIKSTINKCKDKEAIAIADYLVTLVTQAGGEGAHIRIDTLIEKLPTLKEKIDNVDSTRNKGVVLKRTFKKAYELLKDETYLYDKYNDLEVTEILPTMTTLNSIIKITHKGKKDNTCI